MPDDIRITTRYVGEDLVPALFATIHEAGHAQYERALPAGWRGQPVARAAGLTLHESQSLGFEMQLARSPEFLDFLGGVVARHTGASPRAATRALTARARKVERTPIRVDADEMTYPLHILLRADLERRLISGELGAADLPDAWREASARFLGFEPPDDQVGCLQDIHWYGGDFGYFPTYALGAMAAAQLVHAARAALPELMHDVGRGEWSGYLEWSRVHVHARASSAFADDIIRDATGEPLGVGRYLEHLEGRYAS